jgi:hypothetical protein
MLKTKPNVSKRTLSLAFAYVASAIKGEADRELTLESVRRWSTARQLCDDPSIDGEEVIFDIYRYLYSTLNNTLTEKTRLADKRPSDYHYLNQF